MPRLRWILLSAVVGATGCGALVKVSGTDVNDFTTRTAVQKEFGKPSATGVEEGRPYEEYVTHLKLAEPGSAEGLTILDASTFFLAEFVLFPTELYRAADHIYNGQTLHVLYDDKGNVINMRTDGSAIYHPHFDPLAAPSDIQTDRALGSGNNVDQAPK